MKNKLYKNCGSSYWFFGIIILFSENILINNENFFYALMILIGSTFYVIGGLMTLKISKKKTKMLLLQF